MTGPDSGLSHQCIQAFTEALYGGMTAFTASFAELDPSCPLSRCRVTSLAGGTRGKQDHQKLGLRSPGFHRLGHSATGTVIIELPRKLESV